MGVLQVPYKRHTELFTYIVVYIVIYFRCCIEIVNRLVTLISPVFTPIA